MAKSVWPEIWDGSTAKRPATAFRSPSAGDWEQILAEIARDREEIIGSANSQIIEVPTGQPNGTPISVTPTGLVPASHLTNALTIGLAFEDHIQVSGVFESDNLIPASIYYLGINEITAVPPTVGWLVQVGVAWTDTKLILGIRSPIRL